MISKRFTRFTLASVLAFGLMSAPMITPAATAACVQEKLTNKSIGQISIGSSNTKIVPFTYPAGGVMLPPWNTEVLFMSLRHMPLSSSIGTTVLVWHINNGRGCWSNLNFLLGDQKVGFKFKITDETGVTKTYKITQVTIVPKGKYQKDWFSIVGPRKLAIFTCNDKFVNGHYVENKVLLAVPA